MIVVCNHVVCVCAGLASRDFLQYRRSMTNLTNKGRVRASGNHPPRQQPHCLLCGSCVCACQVSVICMRSAPSDKYLTERKGYVRADSVISGTHAALPSLELSHTHGQNR